MNRTRGAIAAAAFAGLVLAVPAGTAFQRAAGAQQAAGGRKAIRPPKAPNTGLPFSPGILAGNTLYVSGTLGRDPVSARLAPGGIEGETRQSLANIRDVLRDAGMDFKDVVSVTAFITDFKDFDKFNAVYREYFTTTDPPARATVQVAALNLGARVELQMIAVKP
ncbi:MAG TPA: RidA family protein [Terriglobia bacterium]|nr:RidA family protein [Terriglobia bacterium]